MTNPRITERRLVDLQSIFVKEAMRINVGSRRERRARIVEFGRAKTTEMEKEKAEFDTKFHTQFDAARRGSEAMQAILPKEDVTRLSRLSIEYLTLNARRRSLSTSVVGPTTGTRRADSSEWVGRRGGSPFRPSVERPPRSAKP